MKDNKLKGKDLINIGIYAAIYCVLMTCIAMLGYIPIMLPMLAVIGPIVLGVPMMLFYTKVKKFGMITIMGTIVGIYLCVTGMGFWPIVFGVVFGFLADLVAKSGKYDAVICLGAVIRGATSHYDYVCSEVSKGIANVSLASDIPVMFGVLTTDTIEQAIERAGTKAGNKGFECAEGAIEMVNLIKEIEG